MDLVKLRERLRYLHGGKPGNAVRQRNVHVLGRIWGPANAVKNSAGKLKIGEVRFPEAKR